MQAGIYYGFVGQIDEIVNRIKEELNEPNVKVIATGGLATLIAKSSKTIDVVDPMLTLKGLLVLYEKIEMTEGKKKANRETGSLFAAGIMPVFYRTKTLVNGFLPV